MTPLIFMPIGGGTMLAGYGAGSANPNNDTTQGDPLVWIEHYTNSFTSLFNDSVLSLADTFWIGYYGLCTIPLLIYIAAVGIQYMIGKLEGDKLKDEMMRFIGLMLLMVAGFTFVPAIDMIGDTFGSFINSKVYTYGSSVAEKVNASGKKNSSTIDFSSSAPENDFLKSQMSGSEMNAYHIYYEYGQQAKNSYGTMTDEDIKVVREMMNEAGIDQSTDSVDPETLKIKSPLPELSLMEFSMIDFLTYCLLVAGSCIKSFMLILRLFILALLRFSFPIAVALSFIPTQHKTIFTWLEAYITVVLWKVVLILISAICMLTSSVALCADSYSICFMAALMAFMSGIFYMLSPAITVMLFGGSQPVAQLPQQTYFAGMAQIGTTSAVAQGLSRLFPTPSTPASPPQQ